VQNLMIDMVVNLLKHRNPYTGLTYADESALCFIELQNECRTRTTSSSPAVLGVFLVKTLNPDYV
jgi:hypothetical protein